MIRGFVGRGTEDIYNGIGSPAARRVCPQALWGRASRKLDLIDSAVELKDLSVPLGNRLEILSGNRESQHSIRANEQYRICFLWTETGADEVEITDYHR